MHPVHKAARDATELMSLGWVSFGDAPAVTNFMCNNDQ